MFRIIVLFAILSASAMLSFSFESSWEAVAQPVPGERGKGFRGVQRDTVKFQVKNPEGSTPTVEVASPPNARCREGLPSGQRKGCVRIDEGNQGFITMEVQSPRTWHFDMIQICPGEEKPVGDACTMSPERIAIFPIIFEGSDGKIQIGRLQPTGGFPFPEGSAIQSFVLADNNPVEEFFFYRVRLCSANRCAWIDPPIENRGVGN